MVAKMSTHEARAEFSDVVSRAAYGGERIILTRRGRALAAIVSVKELARLGRTAPQRKPKPGERR